MKEKTGTKCINASKLKRIVTKPASLNFQQIQETSVILQVIYCGNALSITSTLKHGKTSTRISAWSQPKHSKVSAMVERKNDVKSRSLCFFPQNYLFQEKKMQSYPGSAWGWVCVLYAN